MIPDRLSFLTKFDKFYQELINLGKEDKINEQTSIRSQLLRLRQWTEKGWTKKRI